MLIGVSQTHRAAFERFADGQSVDPRPDAETRVRLVQGSNPPDTSVAQDFGKGDPDMMSVTERARRVTTRRAKRPSRV